MNKDIKLTLLQKLLERRYPADVYDKASKTSAFRLRAERVIYYLNKLEGEINHE